MTQFDENGIDNIFGLPGTSPLSGKLEDATDIICTRVQQRFSAPATAIPP